MSDQFNRQEQLFGAKGQERIKNTHVAIVGVGGTGSHVAQQLAYLGVREFTLIDHDRVETSNLNRLIGAIKEDINRLKIEVVADLIKTISPSTNTHLINCNISKLKNKRAFATVDYVFGCVDNDAARLTLLEECSMHRLSFIDLATDVSPNDETLGGRVFFSRNGKGCLLCAGLLDQEEIREFSESKEDKEFKQNIYGISKDYLKESGPAVVFINGLIASIAIAEFTITVTGMAEPIMFTKIERRGRFNIWAISHEANVKEGCYYCGKYLQKAG
jgi:hypothetical protein